MASIRKGYKLRPNKRLGQHFLVDSQITKKIISLAGFKPSDHVLEIGPGLGALTLPLARSVDHIIAVEKDMSLISLLKEKLSRADITNVTLVNRDILKWDFNELKYTYSTKLLVIGNLPYNISSSCLEKLIENRNSIDRAVLMFQSEVARRLTASPGGKSYGAMTLLIKYHMHPTILLEVSREAFFPRPKVDSMILELDFKRPYPGRTVTNEDRFKKVVKGSFAHRRKTLMNSLKGFFPSLDREHLLKAMEKCHIEPGRRAETLDMDDFLCLSSAISLTKEQIN